MSSPLLLLLLSLLQLLVISPSPTKTAPIDVEERFIPITVCYDGIGCFNSGGNFFNLLNRPVSVPPQSPESNGVTYTVYTRRQTEGRQIVFDKPQTVSSSGFDVRKRTRILVHGFTDNGESDWMRDMRLAILQREDCNVVHLSWQAGATPPYTQATANTRVVGALLAQLVEWLEQGFGASRSRIHIIGHSLGSHIAGYAGERLPGLSRITGMDPAGPFFENTHPEVRLDPTDAEFVDVIHTDGDNILNAIMLNGGFGLMQPLGHVDFYPNGGKQQPNCKGDFSEIIIDGISGGVKLKLTCNHARVHSLVTSSIAGANYKAVQCSSYADFKAGRCTSCDNNNCAFMGVNADRWNPRGQQNVKMFLDTSGQEPFETRQYIVKATLSDDAVKQYGDISVTLVGSNGEETPSLRFVEKVDMEAGDDVTGVVSSPESLVSVPRIQVAWQHRKLISWGTEYLRLRKVSISEMFSNRWTVYCANNFNLASGKSMTLSKSTSC